MSGSSDNRSCFHTKLGNFYWSLTQFVKRAYWFFSIMWNFSWLNIWCGFFLLFLKSLRKLYY